MGTSQITRRVAGGASPLLAGLLTAAATWWWWREVSGWLGFVVALVAATVADMIRASRFYVPLPHIVVFIAGLQYGLAAWASNLYPSLYPEYQIEDIHRYFSYIGPALGAGALGFLVATMAMPREPRESTPIGRHPRLLGELDWLLWGGLAIDVFVPNAPGGLAFVVFLLAGLRFVGAIGWMITQAAGWKWRLALLLTHEVYVATRIGMFHDLILWSLSLLAIYVSLHRQRRLALVGGLFTLVLAVFVLQDAKWTLRQGIWNDRNEAVVFGRTVTFSDWSRPLVTSLCIVDSTTKLVRGGFTDESLGNSITRFNQGWIIDRVMTHVPNDEPYARGETIWAAVEATLLPRVLVPDKLRIDGKANMERFAGHILESNVTMNLGFAGEMYANFGRWRGVIACAVYALVLGLFFRWAAILAYRSPFWWAFAVYAAHWALKAETDVAGVLNYLVKASLLIWVLTFFLPALRAELKGGLGASQRETRHPGRRPQRSPSRRRVRSYPAAESLSPAPPLPRLPAPGKNGL